MVGVGIEFTIYPGITNDNSTLRQLKLRNFRLNSLVRKTDFLNLNNFSTITIAMLMWP